jgi:hypothetical protein
VRPITNPASAQNAEGWGTRQEGSTISTIDFGIFVRRETHISPKIGRADLGIELPVRTVEKGTVSEYLCVPKAKGQEK